MAAPKVAIANAPKQWIAMQALQLLAETRPAGFEVADHTHDYRISRGDIQNPLVVIRPWAAFNFNRAYDTVRRGQLAEALRKRAFVDCAVLRRPWHALRTGYVE